MAFNIFIIPHLTVDLIKKIACANICISGGQTVFLSFSSDYISDLRIIVLCSSNIKAIVVVVPFM